MANNQHHQHHNPPINKFVLGEKEIEGKNVEFGYDKGWYSITEIQGEERNVTYKSKNAQEAYYNWNVLIGRKKERPSAEERRKQRDDSRKENTNNNKRK